MPVLDRLRHARKWLLLLLGAVVVALLPWTAFLTATLPGRHVTHHWDLAWAGFDVFEASALAATFVALGRRSFLLAPVAAVAGTALLCDAWFDLITSQPGDDLRWSLVRALAAELPLAALCFWIALDSSRAVASAARASAAAPRPTVQPAPPSESPDAARTPRTAAPSAGRTSR
jgi:hypothetical protein